MRAWHVIFGVNVDDKVILLANTALRGINAVEVTVRGLFSTVTKSYDDSALRMPISTARQLLKTHGPSGGFAERHANRYHARKIAQQAAEEFEIVPWYALADFYNKTVTLFTKQIQGIRLIIALIILLSITNTMTMNVMERIGEIGTSLALGMKRTGIMRLFVSEGILIGCLGGLLGLTLGLLFAHIISSIGIPMPPPPGWREDTRDRFSFLGHRTESLALAVGTTLLASLYPAWRASRMQIVDALRHNR